MFLKECWIKLFLCAQGSCDLNSQSVQRTYTMTEDWQTFHGCSLRALATYHIQVAATQLLHCAAETRTRLLAEGHTPGPLCWTTWLPACDPRAENDRNVYMTQFCLCGPAADSLSQKESAHSSGHPPFQGWMIKMGT